MKFSFVLLLLFTNILNAQKVTQLVNFDFNKYEVPDTSARVLIKNVYSILPDSICIIGHCDSIGSALYNNTLSYNRAKAIKNILMASGIADNIIKVCIGKGKWQPVVNNTTEQNRFLNRRVEIIFIKRTPITFQKAANKNVLKINPIKVCITAPKIDTVFSKKTYTKGDKIVLPTLKFRPGFHTLLQESTSTLQEVFELLNTQSKLKILICGHVCCTYPGLYDGTDLEYGTPNLSVTRAKEIYEQLIEMGIDKNRLHYKGFGGSKKISEAEDNEQQKSLNRRVELVVLEDGK
jgi:outer membrane protein OmpA-like peptidoglycan-associated protein